MDAELSRRLTTVLAPNPGPMTLTGTNTHVLAEPGARRCVVIDPGPRDHDHLEAVLSAVRARELSVGLIVLTHRHPDHSAGAPDMAARTGAPVRALDPEFQLGDEGLADGDAVEVDGLEMRVLATPGHSSDSVCLVLPAGRAVFTGDHVLGEGTTVVAWPDGRLGDYMESLRRLRRLCEEVDVGSLLPGHGPRLDEPLAALDGYLTHRAERLDQVRAAVAAGDRTVDEVVERVYAEVPRVLWPAAGRSVRAQLDYLAEAGEIPPRSLT